ncbi:MAG: HU family DNA-binding protein [Chloroflexota bacterium]
MTLTKKKMVREIGRRTRLTNREVRTVIDTLIDVWTEALVAGEKIEIEHFLVIEVQDIDRGATCKLQPQKIKRLAFRVSKSVKAKLNK